MDTRLMGAGQIGLASPIYQNNVPMPPQPEMGRINAKLDELRAALADLAMRTDGVASRLLGSVPVPGETAPSCKPDGMLPDITDRLGHLLGQADYAIRCIRRVEDALG